MPCATVHLLVAREALDIWSRSKTSPFEVNDRTHWAFVHGSLGPDLGFIPGVDRFISELAHYHRPADLCRALLDRATSDIERAFAWGWIAHVLGDVALHPMVGRAVGERVKGDRSIRMDAAEDLPTHVATEVGLDMVLLRRHGSIPKPPRTAYLTAANAEGLAGALRDTYGGTWPTQELVRGHRVAVSRTARWPLALATLRRLAPGWRPVVASPAGALLLSPMRWLARSHGAVSGFLGPLRPAPWLVRCVERGTKAVAASLHELHREGLDGMPNRNLETGKLQGEHDPHHGAVSVRRRLTQGLATAPGGNEDGAALVVGSEAGRGVGTAHELDALDVRHTDRT